MHNIDCVETISLNPVVVTDRLRDMVCAASLRWPVHPEDERRLMDVAALSWIMHDDSYDIICDIITAIWNPDMTAEGVVFDKEWS